jgi:GntR family transcriptional regulator
MNEPAYRRVAGDLRHRITSGELAPGTRIPSRTQLMKQYGVGEQTAVQAVRVLQTEGLLDGQFGRGVFVRNTRDAGVLRRSPELRGEGSPFHADMTEQNHYGSWEANSLMEKASPEVAERLGIAQDTLVMCTSYECFADRRPVQLVTSYEPAAITGNTDIASPERGPHAGRGVVDRMEVIGITVAGAQDLIGARLATKEEAEALGLTTGVVVTVIERTHYDTAGRAVETSDVIIPANRWRAAYQVQIR